MNINIRESSNKICDGLRNNIQSWCVRHQKNHRLETFNCFAYVDMKNAHQKLSVTKEFFILVLTGKVLFVSVKQNDKWVSVCFARRQQNKKNIFS